MSASPKKHWCLWCGEDLPAGRRKFCDQTCATSYNCDVEQMAVSYCLQCNAPLPLDRRLYCSRKCTAEHALAKRSGEPPRLSYGGHYPLDEASAALRVAAVGYGTAAAELGLTRGQLVGRLYRAGYRFKAELSWRRYAERGPFLETAAKLVLQLGYQRAADQLGITRLALRGQLVRSGFRVKRRAVMLEKPEVATAA